jgi:hypothetical protein
VELVQIDRAQTSAVRSGLASRLSRPVFPRDANVKVGDAGLEPATRSPNTTKDLRNSQPFGAAQSGAVSADFCPNDTDLRTVVAAWPALPEKTRTEILAKVCEALASE